VTRGLLFFPAFVATATFSSQESRLALSIVDDASKQTSTLSFSGVFNGTLSSKSAALTNIFWGPQAQALWLGNHVYTAWLVPFTPPGPPTANLAGSISAFVSIADVPEPSTLVLGGLCLALGGAGWWWKRLRGCGLAGSPLCPAGGRG
jgi:hypothetical protein